MLKEIVKQAKHPVKSRIIAPGKFNSELVKKKCRNAKNTIYNNCLCTWHCN